MKDVIFFFRDGGIIITQIGDESTILSIGQRMCAGGFITGKDSFWNNKLREVVINLADISCVIIQKHYD